MYKSYSMELAGRTLTVDIDRVAKQAIYSVIEFFILLLRHAKCDCHITPSVFIISILF